MCARVLTKCAMCAHYSVSVGCFQHSFSRHVHRICFCKKSLFWAFHKIFTSYYCNLAWGHISILKYQIITLRYEIIAGTFYSYLQNFWSLKSFLGECPQTPFPPILHTSDIFWPLPENKWLACYFHSYKTKMEGRE